MKCRIIRDCGISGKHTPAGSWVDVSGYDFAALRESGCIDPASIAEPESPKNLQSQGITTAVEVTPITTSLAVVVTCYAGHLSVLKNQLNAVDNGSYIPTERILVLDRCEYDAPEGWQVISGDFHGPNLGRNEALKSTKCEWVVFLDADDVADPEYLRAMAQAASVAGPKVGIIYADVNRNGASGEIKPGLDYFRQIEKNHVSAASCWRRHALTESGGFPYPNDHYDDWTAANRVMSRCWTANFQPWVPVRCYPPESVELEHRSDAPQIQNLWKHRSYTIVSLLAGRQWCFDPWLDWLKNEEKPDHCKLLVVDNSHDDKFHAATKAAAISISGLQSVEIRKCHLQYADAQNKWGEWGMRHVHVSRIYTEILPSVDTDFIVFLEDDVIPEHGSFRKLVESFDMKLYQGKMGGLSATYPSRVKDRIVAAKVDDYWHDCLTLDDVPDDGSLIELGFIAGGFSLWRTAVVRNALPLVWDEYAGHLRGWDTRLCVQARENGWKLFLHSSIRCQHLTEEPETKVIESEPKPELKMRKRRGRPAKS